MVGMTDNVFGLGEGGILTTKNQCGKRILNIAVSVDRSTAPPLLPNVCYTLPFFVSENIF
jgi:hypothetical protein